MGIKLLFQLLMATKTHVALLAVAEPKKNWIDSRIKLFHTTKGKTIIIIISGLFSQTIQCTNTILHTPHFAHLYLSPPILHDWLSNFFCVMNAPNTCCGNFCEGMQDQESARDWMQFQNTPKMHTTNFCADIGAINQLYSSSGIYL